MADRIWTDEQVKNLNEYQNCGYMHPFTWEVEEKGSVDLIATPYGWVTEEGGPVVQSWAYSFMLDGSFKMPDWKP